MTHHNFLKIPEIIHKIQEHSNDLESGKLNLNQLNEMLELSRQLNERMAILRYKALTNKSTTEKTTPKITKEQLFDEIATNKIAPKKEEVKEEKNAPENKDAGFTIDFSKIEESEITPISSQRDLMDQISEDEKSAFSINEKLASEKKASVAEKLQQSKIDDLRTVIGINQKFLFMNDLFEGEKAHYDHTIDKINSLNSKHDVDAYLNNEVTSKFNWDSNNESVKSFKAIVERKFA